MRTPLTRVSLGLLLALAVSGCSSTSPSPSGVAPGPTLQASSSDPSGAPTESLRPTDIGRPPSPVTPSSAASPLPTVAGGLDALTAAALQAVVDQAAGAQHVPGMSVAIRLGDGRTWTGVTGYREVADERPVDPDTVFSVASITKTFVTAVVMQLAHEGKLSLDDPLSRWMPDFPRADQLTVRELLGHTGGVFNYFENPDYNDQVFADPDRSWTVDQILALVGPPYCDPGACYHYSNTDFILLGRIVEIVTGKPIAQVIRSRLTGPLGLTHTVFQPDQPTPKDAASGYLYTDGRWFDQTGGRSIIPHPSAVTVAWAAGAMASNASDLATWAEALYGGDVVAPDLMAQMLVFPNHHDHYGLGTHTAIFDGRRAYGHGGSLRGFQAEMWWFPREGASIVVLGNAGFWDVHSVVRTVSDVLFAGIGAALPEYDPTRNTH